MKRLWPLLLCIPLVGCVDTSIKTRDIAFRTRRFLWEGKIPEASISTNGLVLKGYTSEAAALAEGVARGISSGLKP
jgi:hypothetical protein